jgi:diguanylate cyclase (GGDEF)-like protein
VQIVEQVTGELALELDRLVADAVSEITARVPDYTRSLEAAGEQPAALVAGTLGLMLQGLRDRDLAVVAAPVVRQMGRSRYEAGVALDTLLEAMAIVRDLLARSFERTARLRGGSEHAVLVGVQRLERMETAVLLQLARGYMDAVRDRGRHQRDVMEAMVTVAAALNRTVELSDVAQAGLSAVVAGLNADAGALWTRSPELDELALAYTSGFKWDEDRRLRAAAVKPFQIVERAARSRSVVIEGGLGAAGRPLLRSALAVRLRVRNEVLGVVVVGTRLARDFDRAEAAFAEGAADHFAAALRRAEEHRREARTDFMTGLANRKEFERALDRALAAAKRYRRPLTLVMLDLDGLKRINDEQGHQAGDAAIREVGGALQRAVRASDTSARVGGDEFALAMPDTTVDQAVEVLHRIESLLAASGLRVSAGIAAWQLNLTRPALLKKADARLYLDKRKHHREHGGRA